MLTDTAYIIRRFVDGQAIYLGEFDEYAGTFFTGVPKVFNTEAEAIDIALALNKFIQDKGTRWMVYNIVMNEAYKKKDNIVMPIEVTEHDEEVIE